MLARHGETDWNAPPARVQGWLDEPLNETGRTQARALAERVAGGHQLRMRDVLADIARVPNAGLFALDGGDRSR